MTEPVLLTGSFTAFGTDLANRKITQIIHFSG
jgi:hypothetical protein